MQNGHIFQILLGADPLVQLTLLILLGFSVSSWAIIFFKMREVKKSASTSARFLEAFWKAPTLEDLFTKYASQASPVANVFKVSLVDLIRKTKTGEAKGGEISSAGIKRRIERAVADEGEKLEKYLPFLATTGSTTPFIGLFGTVWGILAAFWQIGKAGSSSLAVVGPFIAEALIATAFGLVVAIPAVIFYNYFITKTRPIIRDLEGFGEDLSLRIQKDYFQS